jgi:hypothetical protein
MLNKANGHGQSKAPIWDDFMVFSMLNIDVDHDAHN